MSLRRSIDRFRKLAPAERGRLMRAIAVVAAVRLAMWILPYRTLRSSVDRAARPAGRRRHGEDAEALGIAVERAARVVPGATCLVQALAAQVLLRRARQDAQVRIGVERASGGLHAHAWAESGGRVVVGGSHLAGLTRLEP